MYVVRLLYLAFSSLQEIRDFNKLLTTKCYRYFGKILADQRKEDFMEVIQMPGVGSSNPDAQKKNLANEKKEQGDQNNLQLDEKTHYDLAAFVIDDELFEKATPEIQNALSAFAKRVEPLHNELRQAQGREAYFRKISEKHNFLNVLSRTEFFRKLRNVLNHSKHLSQTPALVFVHVRDGDSIRRQFGRKALDELLTEVTSAIHKNLEKGDIIGSLGGNDFGVISFDIHNNQLLQMLGLGNSQFSQENDSDHLTKLDLNVDSGFYILRENETLDEVIIRADADLLKNVKNKKKDV